MFIHLWEIRDDFAVLRVLLDEFRVFWVVVFFQSEFGSIVVTGIVLLSEVNRPEIESSPFSHNLLFVTLVDSRFSHWVLAHNKWLEVVFEDLMLRRLRVENGFRYYSPALVLHRTERSSILAWHTLQHKVVSHAFYQFGGTLGRTALVRALEVS